MSVRASAAAAIAAACLFCLGSPVPNAGAQQVSAAPLSQVDPWGMGRLGGTDAVSPQIWANSDSLTLSQLMDGLNVSALSPASRRALARLLLSSTRPPTGGDDVQPARLRLLEQLGESEFALEIRRAFPAAVWGRNADLLTARYELATLRAQTGCRRVSDQRADAPDWLPARALCLALAGDFDTAALAAEQTLSGDAKDPWLLAAIETMRSPARTRPGGRYASPIETAISVSAGLGVSRGAMDGLPPDLAMAVIRHPTSTPDQKRAALAPLLAAGRLSPDDLALANGGASPARPPAGASPAVLLLSQAETVGRTQGAPDAARATAYAAALKSAANADEFQLAALTLLPLLRALPRTPETAPHAETLARAAIAVRDTELAMRWREALNAEGADPWVRARLDYMLSLSGVSSVDTPRVIAELAATLRPEPAAAAPPPARTQPAKAPAQSQAEIRRIESARILFLHAGLGRPTPPAARALIGAQKSVGRGVSDAALLRASAALEAGATGEAALVVLSQMTTDPSAQSFAGVADGLMALRAAGLGREADALALEALQVWKAF